MGVLLRWLLDDRTARLRCCGNISFGRGALARDDLGSEVSLWGVTGRMVSYPLHLGKGRLYLGLGRVDKFDTDFKPQFRICLAHPGCLLTGPLVSRYFVATFTLGNRARRLMRQCSRICPGVMAPGLAVRSGHMGYV